MNKIRIAIMCPSEIAERRFLPSLKLNPNYEFVGLGTASPKEWFGENLAEVSKDVIDSVKKGQYDKAQNIINQYGGKIFDSYEDVTTSPDIDAVYLPLPPALHFKWAKKVLENGKHAFIEKPFTTGLTDTKTLLSIAKEKNLAVQENYMFQYHQQLEDINKIILNGELGDIRLYRISFGFPQRAPNDFRYNKKLGGGAILDCGGYTIKYASMLLGPTAKLVNAQSNNLEDFNVDMFGSAVMVNDKGQTAQLAFGMDNSYKCELEVWGSKARLITNRVLTAPAGMVPEAVIIDSKGNENWIKLSPDDSFGKSLTIFENCVNNGITRENNYKIIEHQAELLNQFIELSSK